MEESIEECKSLKELNSDETRIAGEKTIEDWKDLVENKENTEDIDWCEAFSFFEKRIETRYLNPIRCIKNMNLEIGEGFAMVNLQCSLIETIESFYNGWVYQFQHNQYLKKGERAYCSWDNKKVNNERIFISFFKHREPFKKIIDGSEFYKMVRCGLLHETQTKSGWVIKAKNKNPNCFFELEENKKIIFRNNFQDALEKLIERYKKEITTGDGLEKNELEELRKNILEKFNHICKMSKP